MYRFVECFILAAFFSSCRSQIMNIGDCPQVEVVQDFDISQYTGKWYEVERYPVLFEVLGKCVTSNFSINSDDSIRVYNQQINFITDVFESINGTATFVGPRNEGKLNLAFPSIFGNHNAPYWVLGTDYDNYSVIWSCVRFGHFHLASSWLLSREPVPSNETLNRAHEILDTNRINKSFLKQTDQLNCPK